VQRRCCVEFDDGRTVEHGAGLADGRIAVVQAEKAWQGFDQDRGEAVQLFALLRLCLGAAFGVGPLVPLTLSYGSPVHAASSG
jgi:hypothetical protein